MKENLIAYAFENGELPEEDVNNVKEAIEIHEGNLVSRDRVKEYLQEIGYSSTEAAFLLINSIGRDGIEVKDVLHSPNEYGVVPGSYLTRVSS